MDDIEIITFIDSFDVMKNVELDDIKSSGPQGKLTLNSR